MAETTKSINRLFTIFANDLSEPKRLLVPPLRTIMLAVFLSIWLGY